jgi:hypothetical protein
MIRAITPTPIICPNMEPKSSIFNALTTNQNKYNTKIPIKILMATVPLINRYTWYRRIATRKISIMSRIRIGIKVVIIY